MTGVDLPGLERIDVDAMRACRPPRWPDPDVERAASLVRETIGERDADVPLPEPPPSWTGTARRLFHAYVCAALLDDVRAYHRSHGVPDDVSAATLATVRGNLARHRRIYGVPGLDGPEWALLHVYRGIVFRLGRLVFERARVGPEVAAAVPCADPDAPAVGVHIPPVGPLRPDECGRAFGAAAAFFDAHFPAERTRLAHCTSWLMDPQLADHLPGSNIVAFQRMFTPTPVRADGDGNIVRWVYETTDTDPTSLRPPATALERAIVTHLRDGGHGYLRTGWLDFAPYAR